ncbi:MAG: nicotinate-nucleotide--dimethylbenzimidazole phosphoribosyltransferase [Deltaproteobacteria bacterium]|nr:MAG: nicotinate-nucleotide--dimethylbenzimidazole phosphoribosyltransferase [Deltaproteobacteria bacterium]
MWNQGHRDLVLPRVLGHEIAGHDESGRLYTVWPGQACGQCRYCMEGRENLCEEMRIIGFHSDGGFARHILVPRDSLIPVKEPIEPRFLTFAEPAACVLNGLSRFSCQPDERVIIYGGGVVGMIAALLCREQGLQVTVIEQNQEKISRMNPLCRQNRIELCKDTTAADFDQAINCCASHIAFSLCITKLRKGGRLVYFSALEKNEEIETNLLNLIHYKELEIHGAYGPGRKHMKAAIPFCTRQQKNLSLLIEKTLRLEEVEPVMPHVLSGNAMKYIIDLSKTEIPADFKPSLNKGIDMKKPKKKRSLSPFLLNLVQGIPPLSGTIRDRAQKKVDLKTKPLGALGKIEELAVRMATIQGSLDPEIRHKRLFVFAGDHGVTEEGVSAFPAAVTVQMVENFLDGGAAINTFCRQYGIELSVVDMGVNGEFDDHPMLINKKVARSTKNFAIQKAMSHEEAILSIENGAKVFLAKNDIAACDLAGMGEMGIGNTTSAAATICGASGLSPAQVTGRGTGVDDKGLERKIEVIEKALALHRPDRKDGLDLLTKVGGYELGGICGAVLAAASRKCGVVLDGVISTAAGLIAYLICPEVGPYLIAGHKSVEIGHKIALDIMGLQPVVDLNMRLGEGTGAAITMNLVDLACRMMREMASFEDAGVDSGKTG